MGEDRDLDDGENWSPEDIEDLKIALEANCTIEHASRFLLRDTALPDIEAKARELGFEVRHE